MKITVHQGANTLGGNCVELQSGDQSILIDAGIPVNAGPTLSEKAFNKIAQRASAIFISHPHPDHYGMLAWLQHDIPVYMSSGCKKIIRIAYKFGQTNYNPSQAIPLEGNEITIPGTSISLTSMGVDHSGFASRGFLISGGIENILYSGDLRNHGRKRYLTDRLLNRLPQRIHTFILEGTLLSRNYKGVQSEEEVETQLVKTFGKSNGLTLIAFSSQNIDRLVSVYRSCLQTDKTLVIDPYTAYVLDELRPISPNIPQFSWDNMGILFAANSYTQTISKQRLFKFAVARVPKQMIRSHPHKYILKSNAYVEHFLKQNELLADTSLIYSQWSGYAEGFWKSDRVHHIHCSGHAKIETLKELVNKINPDTLIPIHTEDENAFASSFHDRL